MGQERKEPTIKVAGYLTIAEQELHKFKETKGSMRYDVANDPFGEADLTNIYIRKAAFRKVADALKGAFPEDVTVVVLARS